MTEVLDAGDSRCEDGIGRRVTSGVHGSDNGVVKISSLGPFCDMKGLVCDNFAMTRSLSSRFEFMTALK